MVKVRTAAAYLQLDAIWGTIIPRPEDGEREMSFIGAISIDHGCNRHPYFGRSALVRRFAEKHVWELRKWHGFFLFESVETQPGWPEMTRRAPMRKKRLFSAVDIRTIREKRARGGRVDELALEYGCAKSTMSYICNRITYREVE